MNVSDLFNSNKYDNQIFVRTDCADLSLNEVKKFVGFRINEFLHSSIDNVLLLGDNHFDFIINLWAAVFAGKNIYFLVDKKRINQLDIEYILPDKVAEKSDEDFDFSPKDVEINFFTSGSTGNPKLIKKNLKVLVDEGLAVYKELSKLIGKNSVIHTTSVPPHMFVLTFYIMMAFLNGIIIDTRKVDFPEQLDDFLTNNSILVTSPAFLETIAKYNFNLKISPVMILSAGSPLKIDVQKKFEQMGSKVIDIYGSTEAGVIAYRVSSDEKYLRKFEDVKIFSVDCGLAISSPFFIEDKILINDYAEFINNEQFILKSRSDRLVKIREKRVSLIEVENVILTSDLVDNVYCLKYGDKLCAAVALSAAGKDFYIKNGAITLKKELKKFANKFLEIIPSRWKFLYEIPKTQLGKIDIDEIKNIFAINLSLPFINNITYEQDSAVISILFPKNSNFFEGHFRLMPIIPGVVQVYYARELARIFLKLDLPVWQVKKIKFVNIIKADKFVNLKIVNLQHSVTFEFFDDLGIIYSTGSFAKLINEGL